MKEQAKSVDKAFFQVAAVPVVLRSALDVVHHWRLDNVVIRPRNNINLCHQGISLVHPGLQLSHWDHPKKISVSRLSVIYRGSSRFLAILGNSHVRGVPTLNFGPISTKLGGTVRAIKKMTQKDNGPGPGRNYGETGVFTFGRKVVFGLKMGLTPKNHPKWHFPPWLFGQRHFFSLNNFFRSWPEIID